MKFLIYGPPFTECYGGNMVMYKLAKDLHDLGSHVSFYEYTKTNRPNNYCNNFVDRGANEDEVVIYPEGVESNPLNGQRVIRWILCELGKHSKADVWKTWGATDLIYHYGTYNPTKNSIVKRPLFTMDLPHVFTNYNYPRSGACYTLRKADKFHKMPLNFIHPSDSTCIPYEVSHNMLINVFNKHKYFYCYDPYTFLAIIAALCGCIPIVIPLEGVSKYDWLKSLYVGPYMEAKELTNIAGIAYGIDDISYAESTINNVRNQQDDMIRFGVDTVRVMLADLENADDLSKEWSVGKTYALF
jgi:hypothetical protein